MCSCGDGKASLAGCSGEPTCECCRLIGKSTHDRGRSSVMDGAFGLRCAGRYAWYWDCDSIETWSSSMGIEARLVAIEAVATVLYYRNIELVFHLMADSCSKVR
jgi:hypothetical protein